MSTVGSSSSSFWCYRCNRFVRVRTHLQDSSVLSCPDCNGGFIEEIHSPNRSNGSGPLGSDFYRSRFPAAAMYMVGSGQHSSGPSPSPPIIRRARRNGNGGGERSSFNPVIVLRCPTTTPEEPNEEPGPSTGTGFT